ncbi:MAG TPA: helicase-related protein, partial [Bacteroidia bacterium]|nr:helicase-related protein [Bacteroidia bacterium]
RHGPGRVVFRNRRSAMQGFPRRKVQLVPLAVGEEHVELRNHAAAEFSDEPGLASSGGQDFQLEQDPRVDWLVAAMKQLRPAKVLLICRSKEKVLALEEELQKRVKMKVGVFHEGLTLVQRDRNAAWFSEPDGARLLLCSEIGSEGRNFQFAHHLVLFDLPLHPDLLEQRIGRLDRIGQTEDIQIHVPHILGTGQEALARWYHEGLNAFENNLEGGNRMAHLFGERLRKVAAAMPSPDAESELAALISETAAFHATLKATLAAGRDRLLEMNSFRPEIAAELIAQIRAEDAHLGLESYMMQVFGKFGIDVEDLAPRTYLLHAFQGNAIAFPGLADEGMGVTFDRKRALGREEIGFLSWDHPMVTGAMDLVLGSGTGSASFGVLKGAGAPGILLEVLFVLETAGAQGKGVDRFLPHTPLRMVVDHSGADVTHIYSVETLDQQLRPGQVDDLLENESFVESILPGMLAAATTIAEACAAAEIARGLGRMEATMDAEIDRLKALQQKNNHIRPAEIEIAVAERASLDKLIRNARIRLDALQLIRKG